MVRSCVFIGSSLLEAFPKEGRQRSHVEPCVEPTQFHTEREAVKDLAKGVVLQKISLERNERDGRPRAQFRLPFQRGGR
jgi:hypothetical protein